ncbi:signal peptidase I [Pseudarthrobacter cellobiosi]|uniref:signal peptidase I n=1 Tax=Pseudarthrobacter cellobiosi TaxID=2953654 RepID=UPI00208F6ADF|nr:MULTISPECIES: signal peptidase I [unclassified Pseudarthrobacter]MCO4257147.1 signal peptidase I [Pseudarthrobacter sp. HLT1-5]MCO4274311.1 signal peptidase I [Pseudarthrobacter sp. HLT3-5]
MPENNARTPEPPREGAPGAGADGMSANTISGGGTSDGVIADDGASDGVADGSPSAPRSGRRSAAPTTEPAEPSQLFVWLKEVATVVVIAVVLSFLIKTFLFRAFYIPSESMVSTLDVNDRIFVNLLVPEPFSLSRGDVVVFRDTKGWLSTAPEEPNGPFTWVQDGLTFVGLLPDNSEQHLVKRVVGLPGDHVICCDAGGKLTINGSPIDETYVNRAEEPQIRAFDVVVPEGKVWVMGDNRNHSADSRSHLESNGGFVDLVDVEGKAAVIAWPLNRITVLDNYPAVFRNVPAGG